MTDFKFPFVFEKHAAAPAPAPAPVVPEPAAQLATEPVKVEAAPAKPAEPAPVAQETPAMTVVTTIENDINLAETWISAAASKVEKLFAAEAKVAPQAVTAITTTVTDLENFLAMATPAVAGEGLNFGADTAAYAAFVKLVSNWQALATVVEAAVKAL